MPDINKKKYNAIQHLLHGWGFVEGEFVFVPIWDPPEEKINAGYRDFNVAVELLELSKFVSIPEVAKKINGYAMKIAGNAPAGLQGFEDGYCGTPWHKGPPWWGPWSLHGKVKDSTPKILNNILAGYLLTELGKQIKNNVIIEIGEEVLQGKVEYTNN